MELQPQDTSANCIPKVEKVITLINLNRVRQLSGILFFANFGLMFIDYLNKTKGLWTISDGYKYLFYCHIVLGLTTLFCFTICLRYKLQSPSNIKSLHKFFVFIFASFILVFAAFVSGWVDQHIHNAITVYVMSCIAIAAIFNFHPKISGVMYAIACGLLITFLTIAQTDLNIRQGHYENAVILTIVAYFLSTTLYKLKKQDIIHKQYLEDLVSERTRELQAANDLLKQEIDERKRTEVELARLDRLNLVGEMAASISHEVRNPMTTVKGFLQLLRRKQQKRDQEFFDLMIEELDRANSILTEFLSISRTKATKLQWCNINDIITATLPLIEADAQNYDKHLVIELQKLPDLQLNLQEIRQLLLNIVRNGFEAMSSGGQLKIRTFSTNDEIALAVTDQGSGIEPQVLEKLGTPFFSTKEEGTGLGLAVCYGIIARHNGRLSIETSPQGSTFYVYFKNSEPVDQSPDYFKEIV